MQLSLLLCLGLLCLPLGGLGHSHPPATKKSVRELPAVPTAAPAPRDFAFDLFRALVAASPDQNVVFSPLSISVTLAMISLGARSHTKAQILEGLGVRLQGDAEEQLHRGFQQLLQELSRPRDDLQLSLGNALFVQPAAPIRDSFLGALRTRYLADTLPANFGDPQGAQKQINDYVAKQTKGKIVDLVQDLDGTEVMVMVNYIFFKAKWETNFNLQSTKQQDFHVSAETVVPVPMMRREDQYRYLLDRDLSCRVVAVPYQGNASALFILPGEGSMGRLEAGLSQDTLRRWHRMFTERRLQLYLPRFAIEGAYQLEKVLPRLGVTDLFTSQADLTGLTNHSNIQVSEMVHKAVVEVDESGTRAAAATGVVFAFRSARVGSPKIVFNRPFLMAILEGAETVLFLGKVTRPRGGDA